jgi:thioredoxin reductase/pSer/pThr/pTyr-binding forkhead associated (FHA) protein/ferredoxin
MNQSGGSTTVLSLDDVVGTEVLDLLIVGGGPAGTAAAFRARELGLRAFVIDFDDILKRIRDYPKDKLILPDFGGGDKMKFPAGGQLIEALQFGPIDKDDLCERWKQLYRDFDVPFRVGIEFTGLEREGDAWVASTWDHKRAEAGVLRARHVVLALGRGVPRRFDIPGDTDGIAYRLDDPARYVEGPVMVVGGGTSAAEAVIAISNAKAEAENGCAVYWSYRGTKMPRISRALADEFFEAYVGNGNIKHYSSSEPVAVVTAPDRTEYISFRVDRKTPDDRPPETVNLEFLKTRCVACIGEDIPEALLREQGVHMVSGGPGGKKMMVLTPLLETRQPRLYLMGDLLSQSYLETEDFDAPAETYRAVKHRGNIKTSLRDGVFVAEVVKQRLEGRDQVEVVIRDAELADAPSRNARITSVLRLGGEEQEAFVGSPDEQKGEERAYLVLLGPGGVEAEEFNFDTDGVTTLGRTGADISFPNDTFLSDEHASITERDGAYFLRDDGSRSGTYLKLQPERPVQVGDGDLIRAGRQILVVSHRTRGEPPTLEHYNSAGELVGTHPLSGTAVLGRSGGRSNPDVILDDEDMTLSRFHFAFAIEEGVARLQDFGSRNGTFFKVEAERKLEHGDVVRIGGQELQVRFREDLPQKADSFPVPVVRDGGKVADAGTPEPAPPPAAAPAATAGPHVTFGHHGISGAIDSSQSLLEWADEKDVALDYECWIGMCGCDIIRIVSGAEHLNPINDKERKTLQRKGLEAGPFRLACMTRASGPVVVEAAD